MQNASESKRHRIVKALIPLRSELRCTIFAITVAVKYWKHVSVFKSEVIESLIAEVSKFKSLLIDWNFGNVIASKPDQ